MPTPDAALAAFKHAWLAGEDPDPRATVDSVAPAERAELRLLLEDWVALAPPPGTDHEAVALDALGELLGTTGAALAGAGAATVPRPAIGALLRGEAGEGALDFGALSAALHSAPPEDWDAVDELFCGGR